LLSSLRTSASAASGPAAGNPASPAVEPAIASRRRTTRPYQRLASANEAGPISTTALEEPDRFPNALATMWTWITDDVHEADRVVREVLAPLLRRDPEGLGDGLCIGPAQKCAELLARYARAGCDRVYLWPLGDEPRQIELAATALLPATSSHSGRC
jgi:hypothetical protein